MNDQEQQKVENVLRPMQAEKLQEVGRKGGPEELSTIGQGYGRWLGMMDLETC